MPPLWEMYTSGFVNTKTHQINSLVSQLGKAYTVSFCRSRGFNQSKQQIITLSHQHKSSVYLRCNIHITVLTLSGDTAATLIYLNNRNTTTQTERKYQSTPHYLYQLEVKGILQTKMNMLCLFSPLYVVLKLFWEISVIYLSNSVQVRVVWFHMFFKKTYLLLCRRKKEDVNDERFLFLFKFWVKRQRNFDFILESVLF